MNDMAKMAKLRDLLNSYRGGNFSTSTAITQIADILDVAAKPDVPAEPVIQRNLSNRDKVRNVLNAHQKGQCQTNEAIEQISDILGVEIESNIEFGTVFTGIFGKCIAMSEPDKQGHFFAYSAKGYREVYHVSNVQEIHPSWTEQMQRVFTDLINPMVDKSPMWYNKPIPNEFREQDEYTNPAHLYRL